MVVLHPSHFLPVGNLLKVYRPPSSDVALYGMAQDGVLRRASVEEVDDGFLRPTPIADDAPRFPSFKFEAPTPRDPTYFETLNPYLVILSAHIKFRRYKRSDWPPLETHYQA